MFSTKMSRKNKNVQTSVSSISAEWQVISGLSLWLMGAGEVVADHLGLEAGKLGGLLTSYVLPFTADR